MIDHDILIQRVKKALDLKSEPKKIGQGSMGIAYLIDDKVYKITSDTTEYVNSKKLVGKDFHNIAKIYATYQLKGLEKDHNMANEDFFLIVLEYLTPLRPYVKAALAELNDMLDYYGDFSELFSDMDDNFYYYYESETEDVNPQTMEVANEVWEIYSTLYGLNIFTADLFMYKNYGMKNGELAIFDIGYGDSESYARDKEHLELYEEMHFKPEETEKYLAHFGFKPENYWASGGYGDAYFKGDTVLKLTTDKDEAVLAKKMMGQDFKQIAKIEKILYIERLGAFAILMERLDKLPTEVKKAYHNISSFLKLKYWAGKYYASSEDEKRELFNKIKNHFGGDSDEFMVFWDVHNLLKEFGNISSSSWADIHIDNLGIKNGRLAAFDISGYIRPSEQNKFMSDMGTLNEVNVIRKLKSLSESEVTKWVINKLKNLFKRQTNPIERVEIIMSLLLTLTITSLLTANVYRSVLGAFSDSNERKELIIAYDKVKKKAASKELKLPNIDAKEIPNNVDVEVIDKSFGKFLDTLAFRESSRRWDIINNYGYMGLYQIGPMALKDISQRSDDPDLKDIHKKVTPERFKKNPNIFPPELQEKAIKQLLSNNKHYLRRYTKYIGQTVGGIRITESGLLAASHLVGNSSVKKFLKSDGKTDPADGNGVKASEYLKMFSNYAVDL